MTEHVILHIDPSNFVRKILDELYTRAGIQYLSADSGESALKILDQEHNITLIFTSLELPDMNGQELVEKINKSKYKDIPIIVLSSNDSLDLRNELFSLGVIDYISKNTSAEVLVEYIQKLYVDKFIKNDTARDSIKDMSLAVLDDSPSELRIIQNMLDLSNIKRVDYFSLPDRLMETDKMYDMYLIDLVLPDYSAERIIVEIKKKNPDSLIIIVSAIAHHKAISNVLLSGADDYIQKPFNMDVFIARLKANARMVFMINELKRMNMELEELVVKDGLTMLFNHRHLYERLDQEMKSARRYHKKLTVMMIDIDHFKMINDKYGHQTGDRILIRIASLLKNTFRETDIVGRYGGEEFLIIQPETEKSQTFNSALRIQEKMKDVTLPDGKPVTISGGVLELEDDESAQELVHRVDLLLYEAKNRGRNRILMNDLEE